MAKRPHRINISKNNLGDLSGIIEKYVSKKEDIELYYSCSPIERMVSYAEIMPVIKDVAEYKFFQNISISGIPLCVFPQKDRAWTVFVSLLASHPKNIFLPKCHRCLFRKMCLGVPSSYVKKFTDTELCPPSEKDLFVSDFNDIEKIKPYWSLNVHRQEHYWNLFFKDIPGKILDAGSGLGEFVSLSPKRIVGIDSDPERVNNAMARLLKLDLRCGDICHLDFHNEEFMGVFCNLVLEHMGVKEAKAAIKEMTRVLKPGGKLLIIAQGKDGKDGWLTDRKTTRYTRKIITDLAKPCHFKKWKVINGAYVIPYANFNFDSSPIKFSDKEIAIGLMAEK
jgi:SAM-dependent methyltransferase